MLLRCTISCNSDALRMKFTNSYVEHVQRKSLARKRATLLGCTCTELARSLHGACTQTCQALYQSTFAKFFGIYIKRSIHTKYQQHAEFSPAPQHTTQNITRLSPPLLPLPPLPPRPATTTTSASVPSIPCRRCRR